MARDYRMSQVEILVSGGMSEVGVRQTVYEQRHGARAVNGID